MELLAARALLSALKEPTGTGLLVWLNNLSVLPVLFGTELLAALPQHSTALKVNTGTVRLAFLTVTLAKVVLQEHLGTAQPVSPQVPNVLLVPTGTAHPASLQHLPAHRVSNGTVQLVLAFVQEVVSGTDLLVYVLMASTGQGLLVFHANTAKYGAQPLSSASVLLENSGTTTNVSPVPMVNSGTSNFWPVCVL